MTGPCSRTGRITARVERIDGTHELVETTWTNARLLYGPGVVRVVCVACGARINEQVDPVTAASIGPHRCICGRGFAKRAGKLIHQRTCPVERERSAAFVDAVERGDWAAFDAAYPSYRAGH